jgi:hypothetical protein
MVTPGRIIVLSAFGVCCCIIVWEGRRSRDEILQRVGVVVIIDPRPYTICIGAVPVMAWQRGRSYSQDLRERVLAADELTCAQAAHRYSVSISYVVKARARRDQTGVLDAE